MLYLSKDVDIKNCACDLVSGNYAKGKNGCGHTVYSVVVVVCCFWCGNHNRVPGGVNYFLQLF